MPADLQVLHVFSSAGLYGAEQVVLGLIPALRDSGINSTLLCIDNPRLSEQVLYQHAHKLGIQAERIACAGRIDRATTRALREALNRHPGAIVHVHGYKGAFYVSRARAGNSDLPIVATLHGWVTTTRSLRLYRWLELRLLRRFQGVCIVSEAMRDSLIKAGIDSERIHLIENGIDTARFLPDVIPLSRAEFGIPADAFLYGSVMRLSTEKNPAGLIDAFAQVIKHAPQAWLAIVGEGPLRGSLEEHARELGVAERVRLLGSRDDPERFYPMLDCFVLPSLTEGLPLSLLEAMATTRPVICSDVGQIATVLDGLPSRLIAAGDTAALTSAMHDALGDRRPMPALRQRVEARYSVARMAREYAALYREIWSNRGHIAA
ncbi:MAG: glycosyltransferase [Xanthomonadaceae bacterium]|nr:glycosyltransferase [Xanthomonadaceae bacterium]